MTMAKGITNGAQPMGAVAVSERIHDTIMGAAQEGAIEFFHGYTYSGHPAACAAGLATLDIYRNEDLFERGARAVAVLPRRACGRCKDTPVVTDIRGYGMFGRDRPRIPTARPGKRGHAFQKKLFDNGLHLKATGDCGARRAAADRGTSSISTCIVDILRKTLAVGSDRRHRSASIQREESMKRC